MSKSIQTAPYDRRYFNPGTWGLTLGSESNLLVAINLPSEVAANEKKREVAHGFPGHHLCVVFEPTPEQRARWDAEEQVRSAFDVDCGDGFTAYFNPNRPEDMVERADLLARLGRTEVQHLRKSELVQSCGA